MCLQTFYYKWFVYPSFFNLCQTFPIKPLQNPKMFTGMSIPSINFLNLKHFKTYGHYDNVKGQIKITP